MYPSFWKHVVQVAQTLALKEAAVAANKLILGAINARWDTIDDSTFSASDEPEYYIRRYVP